MSRLILLFAVFTIAVDQVLARNLAKSVLRNSKKHHQLMDEYQEQRDDEDDDSIRSLNTQDFGKLVEVALKANGKNYGVQKRERVGQKEKNRNKNLKYRPTLFDQLNRLGENDVLVYDPDSYSSKHEREDDMDGLESSSYDKAVSDELGDNLPVYVIVQADDFQRNKPEYRMNDLFSSLVNSASSRQKSRNNGREDHHRGYRVSDFRRARDSSEMYSSREAEEKRPFTRPRAFGGGRTPIPYIKHRGDIYEKDN